MSKHFVDLNERRKPGPKKRHLRNYRAHQYLFNIPDEVFQDVIFKFIPLYDIFTTVSLVCRQFKRCCVYSLRNRKISDHRKVFFLLRGVPGRVFYERLYNWRIVDTDLYCAEIFLYACKRGHTELAIKVKNEHYNDVKLNDWDNFAIRMAARSGHVDIVKYLISKRVVDPGSRENAAIFLASMRGHTECVRALIRDDRVNPADCSNAALKEAAYFGHKEVCQILIRDERVLSTVGTRRAIENARVRHRKYKEKVFKEIMVLIKNALREYQLSIDMV